MLCRYQYDNFHLHITIIIQITNYKSNYQIPNYKSNQIKCWFLGEGKSGVPGEKPLGAERRINKLSPLMTPSPGTEPRPHWWKVSALTTAPTVLPTLFAIRVIKMIVPHVVPNNPLHKKEKKKQENKHKHTAVLLSMDFRLWMISMTDSTTS